MHEGKIVFSQLMDHLPHHSFRRCVERNYGDEIALTVHLITPFPTPQSRYSLAAFSPRTLRRVPSRRVAIFSAMASSGDG
jgi:hypothetical protein